MSQYLTDAEVTKRALDTLVLIKALARLETENAELRTRVETLEGLIISHRDSGDCGMELCREARAIRARLEGEKR